MICRHVYEGLRTYKTHTGTCPERDRERSTHRDTTTDKHQGDERRTEIQSSSTASSLQRQRWCKTIFAVL